jgi:dihydroorotate dehydrogenase electron transfer subunit
MDCKSMKYTIGTVHNNFHLKGDYYLCQVKADYNECEPVPGQFYQVKTLTISGNKNNSASILFKPLSIYDYSHGIISFMVKVIGKGTAEIGRLAENDQVALIGPLGKGFVVDNIRQEQEDDIIPVSESSKALHIQKEPNILLISGGIGYAPLYYLNKKLHYMNLPSKWLHGGRTAKDIFPADFICTDDGSEGDRGLVTKCLPDLLSSKQNPIRQIYCCGPKPMMKVVWGYAQEYGVPVQFSLEEYMACGIGVCLGCAVRKSKTVADKPEYFMVCKDGPVFNAEEIDWNE